MRNLDLEQLINTELNAAAFQDYAPNGLQVEGRPHVQRIVTGVTACQALLDAAVAHQADAIIVHHGYFWKNEAPAVRGMKRNRLKTLLTHDINLYGYHLPLDAHPVLGNNAQLAQALGIRVIGEVEPLVPHGEFEQPLTGEALQQRIESRLGRAVLHCGDNAPEHIRRVARCTGGGRALSTARHASASMRSSAVKCLSRPFTARAKWACISSPPATTPPSAAA